MTRRNLIVARVGANSLHPRWLDRPYPERDFDLQLSFYSEEAHAEFTATDGVSAVLVKGGKWDGLFKTLSSIDLDAYDRVWLPDDDIDTTTGDINTMFGLCETYGLAVAQPALSRDSYFSHFLFSRCPSLRLRYTNYIEIMVSKLLHQATRAKGKIYALHAPEVDGISKGKARVRYEFGCKVSVATTIDGGFVVGMRAMPGNPYDGHTLAEALEQVETLTDRRPALAVVDRGYRGHDVRDTQVLISGMRRGLTKGLKAQLRRRSAIEPEIGHMKTDGRLARCPLKGTRGDAIFAVLCGCGHNIRKILARLRGLFVMLLAWRAAARHPIKAVEGHWRKRELAA